MTDADYEDLYPGLQVASRSIVNAEYELLTTQTSYVNNMLLGLIGLLAAVTLANTLVVAILERRESLLLLRLEIVPTLVEFEEEINR